MSSINKLRKSAALAQPMPLGALAAGVSFSLLSSAAMAQNAPAQATDQALPTVTVKGQADTATEAKRNVQTKTTTIGKGTQAIRDIPQSITVITEKLIDDVKLDTLKQALHYTSGVTFAATENGTDQDIRLRGFPIATTGDLMIDGMRDPSQYDRDTFAYDRIEVMRGSASMIFGRGSTGGVVNQVMKKPMLADQSDVVGTIGDKGYRRATGDFNVRTGENAALRINAMITKSDNGGAEIDKRGIAPSYSWGLETADEFTVGLYHLDSDNVPQAAIRYLGGTVPRVEPGDFYGTDSDYMRGEATFVSAAWKHRFAGGGELRSQLRSGVFHRSQWGTTAGFGTTNGAPTTAANLSDATILTRSGLSPRKDRYEGTYVQSDYSNTIQTGSVRHELLAGFDAAQEKARRFGGGAGGPVTNFVKGNTTVGNPDDGRSLAVSPVYRETSAYSADAVGLYAQDLAQVAPHWKILGGIRWDRFKADMGQTNYVSNTNNGITTTPSSELKYSSLWSYRTGVLYQPTTAQSYHLSYGTSFNTSADTYQFSTALQSAVPAEKSRNIELGAKLDWLDGKLSTRGALFRTEKYNERATDADFAGVSVYTLSGKRHSSGIELDVVGRISAQWEIYASYTHIINAKIDQAGTQANGNPLPNSTGAAVQGQPVGLTPKKSGSVWASYQATPKIRVAAGVHGASSNRPLSGSTGAASTNAKVSGYTATDAMVEYKFNPDLFAQLNVTNVTDKRYGDQLYPAFVVLGEPRSVKLSVGLRF